MNKRFINLLLVLAGNFSLYSSERELRYDQENETGPTLEQRAAQIREAVEKGQSVCVWILHTKYNLDPESPLYAEKSEVVLNFLNSIIAFDQLEKPKKLRKMRKDLASESASASMEDVNGTNDDRSSIPNHMDPTR
jgi:hypothetical protein